MALLTELYYPSIRAVIDVSLTTDDLPDEILALPIFLDAGVTQVLDKVPDAESMTGSDRTHVVNAAVYYTAALLVTGLPDIVGETFGTYIYKRTPTDRNKQAILLQSKGDGEIDVVLGITDDDRPRSFDVAKGHRGDVFRADEPLTSPLFPDGVGIWGI